MIDWFQDGFEHSWLALGWGGWALIHVRVVRTDAGLDSIAYTYRYPNAEVKWAQEEHKNGGGWVYARQRIRTALQHSAHHQGKITTYAGRAAAASTATGNKCASLHIPALHALPRAPPRRGLHTATRLAFSIPTRWPRRSISTAQTRQQPII